jgi:hypothetical protein
MIYIILLSSILYIIPSASIFLLALHLEGVTKSFRTGLLERELQMVQLPLYAVVSLFCESV